MAYDEILASRIREALGKEGDVTERKMFGGLCFLVKGHMACGIVGNDLMLRLGEGYEAALKRAHVRPMDFTGRPMRGMVYVGAAGIKTKPALAVWLEKAAAFARTLPPKKPKVAKFPRVRKVQLRR